MILEKLEKVFGKILKCMRAKDRDLLMLPMETTLLKLLLKVKVHGKMASLSGLEFKNILLKDI
jgi:hypothetical protein